MLIQKAFLTPYLERHHLTQVTGRFWNDVPGTRGRLVDLLLHFEQTMVTLSVTEEDEIDTVSRISGDDAEMIHEVDLTDELPWRPAIGHTLMWTWEMTNQQGYLDGVQLEFTGEVASESVTVQLLALGAQLEVREISSRIRRT